MIYASLLRLCREWSGSRANSTSAPTLVSLGDVETSWVAVDTYPAVEEGSRSVLLPLAPFVCYIFSFGTWKQTKKHTQRKEIEE